jgi:hypothetical protein
MVGTLGPVAAEGEPRGEILPLNFGLTGLDERAWQALKEAKESAESLFKIWGAPFWFGYVLAGDFLPLTLYRCLRILIMHRRIRQALSERNIYLNINTVL